MKKFNYDKGRFGEELAKKYLVDKGYCLIESNFEIDNGEIDLIMTDKDWLVFVEVKYKRDDRMGTPEEMVNKRKIAQVRRVAEIYLMRNPEVKKIYIKYRIDAVCILDENISHYTNLYA